MKVIEKSESSQIETSGIDRDTGLPTEILRAELLKGANSGIVDKPIEEIVEGIKKRGRERVKALKSSN